jgi:hypothetical protein
VVRCFQYFTQTVPVPAVVPLTVSTPTTARAPSSMMLALQQDREQRRLQQQHGQQEEGHSIQRGGIEGESTQNIPLHVVLTVFVMFVSCFHLLAMQLERCRLFHRHVPRREAVPWLLPAAVQPPLPPSPTTAAATPPRVVVAPCWCMLSTTSRLAQSSIYN